MDAETEPERLTSPVLATGEPIGDPQLSEYELEGLEKLPLLAADTEGLEYTPNEADEELTEGLECIG